MTHRIPRSVRLIAIVFLLFPIDQPLSIEAQSSDDACVVSTPSGVVRGVLRGTGCTYLGIPYATPPVGDLRWKPPQPKTPWAPAVLSATVAPPNCSLINPPTTGQPTGSEDCLMLNIWAPPRPAQAPVIVWFHPGNFQAASANLAAANGERFAQERNAIVVAPNYRLGPFGFLAHSALTLEDPAYRSSGNYGLLDQRAALVWVRDHIAAFGGDPRNVTIMGQSAGSASVSILQASPLSRGLFHRAVGMSGGALGANMGRARPLNVAEQWGRELQTILKATSLAALRQLPADRILAMQGTTGRYGPLVDGWLLPDDPNAIFAAGKQNDVPILIGYTRDEGFDPFNQVMTVAEYRAQAERWGEHASELLRMYPANTDAEARRAALDIARDATLGLQMRTWARAQTTNGKAPVHMYLFSRVHPYAPGVKFADHDPAIIGAYHTGDVPYWLQTLDSLNLFRTTRNWTQYDRELATRMSDVIVSFARTGKPVLSGTDWPAYRSKDERVVELGDSIRVTSLPNSSKIDFLAAHPPREPVMGEGARPRNRD